jgi:hypothetical protein
MFGSVSHLAARGLENYSEEVVKTYKIFTSMLPRTCSVTHLVFAPLGGVDSAGLVRDMYDLDCWLRTGQNSNACSLPLARAKLWEVLKSENTGTNAAHNTDRTLFLPESMQSSTKIRTKSPAPDNAIPARIQPLSEAGEKIIIGALFTEVNDKYALDMDPEPALTRCSVSQSSEKTLNNGRIFTIGASHVVRTVGGLMSSSFDIVNCAKPGWQADKAAIAELGLKLKNYNITDEDVIIIDPLANSIFCGTDSEGDHVDPVKLSDGKYHIPGDLTCRSKSKIKKIMDDLAGILPKEAEPRLILIVPVPRYVTTRCCSDPAHITNFEQETYVTDIDRETDTAEDLLTAWGQTHSCRSDIVHFRAVADDAEGNLPDLQVGGQSFWRQDDPVHCTEAFYAGLARLLLAMLAADDGPRSSEEAEPAPKRARLESIVVQREQGGASSAPKKSTASWSTGYLPPMRGRATRGWPRGGRPFRGRGLDRSRGYRGGGRGRY